MGTKIHYSGAGNYHLPNDSSYIDSTLERLRWINWTKQNSHGSTYLTTTADCHISTMDTTFKGNQYERSTGVVIRIKDRLQIISNAFQQSMFLLLCELQIVTPPTVILHTMVHDQQGIQPWTYRCLRLYLTASLVSPDIFVYRDFLSCINDSRYPTRDINRNPDSIIELYWARNWQTQSEEISALWRSPDTFVINHWTWLWWPKQVQHDRTLQI